MWTKERILVLVLSVALLASSGCAIIEGLLLGVHTKTDPVTGIETTVPNDGPSPLELILGIIAPGLAGLGGVARWGYVEAKNKNLGPVAKAMVVGIANSVNKLTDMAKRGSFNQEEFAEIKAGIYGSITEASKIHANRDFFKEFVAKVKAQLSTLNV